MLQTILILLAGFGLLWLIGRAPTGMTLPLGAPLQALTAGDGGKTAGGVTLTDAVKLAMRVIVTLAVGAYAIYILFLRGEATAGEHELAAGFLGAIVGYWLK